MNNQDYILTKITDVLHQGEVIKWRKKRIVEIDYHKNEDWKPLPKENNFYTEKVRHLFYRECEMAKGAVAEVESSGGRVKSAVQQLSNIL